MAAGTSVYGDWLTTVALLVLLFRLTHSPFGPALYMLARVAPRIVGPFPGGALADRFGPARIAAGCAVCQGILTGAIVVFADLDVIWAIYVAVALAQLLRLSRTALLRRPDSSSHHARRARADPGHVLGAQQLEHTGVAGRRRASPRLGHAPGSDRS